MKEMFLDLQKFDYGLQLLLDTTKSPFGSARTMRNVIITDRGGIANRPGRKLIGTKDTTGGPTVGFFNFQKSFGTTELLIKAYDDKLKYLYPDSLSGQYGTVSFTTPQNNSVGLSDITWEGQVFTTTDSFLADQVKLTVDIDAAPVGIVTVSIRATTGGLPTGPDLASGTFNADTLVLHPAYQQVVVSLGVGVLLAANTKYALVVRAPSQAINSLNWAAVSNVSSINGVESSDSGVTWSASLGVDLLFEVSNSYGPAWQVLKTGLTSGKEFGFKEHLVNTDNEDFVYMCNRYDPYQRWQGSVTRLSGALVGAEVTVTVQTDGVLKPDVLDSKTASASSATTLNVAGTPWVASQWVNMYVKITSGAKSGQIRKITANANNQITFDTLGGDPLTPSFEIRIPKFPASGSIIYNSTVVAYTAIPAHNQFTVASAAASAGINDPVALVPTEYPGNPRGNRLEVHLTRMVVGNVRSALSRDSGGALQGSTVAGSVYVSKLKDATDFTFSASRVAGEGDIISTPYGGGDITDVVNQENLFYIFKKNYIESDAYSQDSNDLVARTPLNPGTGSVGKVIRGRNDLFFVTGDNQITSVSRIRLKDSRPQLTNIGLPIKRFLETLSFSKTVGAEFRDRIIIAHQKDSTSAQNDQLLLYNLTKKAFEGLWDVGCAGLQLHSGDLYQADSVSPNVYELFQDDKTDYEGATAFPVTSEWVSNFFNVTRSHGNVQSVYGLYVEGYIRANTSIEVDLYRDFATDASLTVKFSGTEESHLSGQVLQAFLGSTPLGVTPMGSISDPDADGRRHFFFIVYFPFQLCHHLSVGVQNTGTSQDWEITRFGMALSEEPTYLAADFKSLT